MKRWQLSQGIEPRVDLLMALSRYRDLIDSKGEESGLSSLIEVAAIIATLVSDVASTYLSGKQCWEGAQ